LLSISQASNCLSCVEWLPSESGPGVVQYKKIAFQDKSFINFLENILGKLDNKIHEGTNKNLTLSLDSNNVSISSFKYDKSISLKEKIDWYENIFLGPYVLKNYDIYYYSLEPISAEILVIYIDKQIKKNILESCEKHGFNLKHLSIDIFSANSSLNMYNGPNENYILWKIGKNKNHTLLFFKDKNFSNYINFNLYKKIEILQSFGSEYYTEKLVSTIEHLVSYQKMKSLDIDFFDQIYVYQTKNNYDLLKQISSIDTNTITLMNIGSKFLNKNSKNKISYNLLSFNENGNSLEGIDV
tara:strand:+ start:17158 stop:18051 length:894 start_codon:yes stop_codon:yes gene_type:complete